MRFILSFILSVVLLSSCRASKLKTSEVILTSENTLVLNDEVNAMTVAQVTLMAQKLNAMLDDGEAIYLVLNTPGGSISDGLELIQNLKSLGRPVHTVTIFAASMGFQTVQGLDKRLILKYGELMSHKARGGFQGEFGGQDPGQLSNRYNFWLSKLKDLDNQTVKRTNGKQTLESYQKAYENELWLTGQEAVSKGYADEVVTAKCDVSLSSKITNISIPLIFGIVANVTVSNCPLITGPLGVTISMKTNKGTTVTVEDFISSGGQFGSVCAISKDVLCPLDLSLTKDRIEQARQEVLQKYSNKKLSLTK